MDKYCISGLRGGQAFTEPYVPVSWIHPREQQVLESIKKLVAVWKLFFKHLEAAYSSSKSDNIDIDKFESTKELLNIDAVKENLKTPKRNVATRLSDIMESAIDTQANSLQKRQKLVKFKDNVKMEDSVEGKILKLSLILEQWNKIVNQMEILQSSYNLQISDIKAFREKLIGANFDLQLAINRAEDMGRLLQDEIGTAPMELQGMSLWEGLEKLVDDNSNIQEEFKALKSSRIDVEELVHLKMSLSTLQEALAKVESWATLQQRNFGNVKIMEDNLIKFKDHYMKFIPK